MDRQERVDHLLVAVGTALEMAQSAYVMLLDELSTDTPPLPALPELPPEPAPIASEDPEACEHPRWIVLPVNPSHFMCEDCGKDLGPQFINGG